jgi:hypothetical protein
MLRIDPPDPVAVEVTRNQLQALTDADARCRGLQLPEGLLLRYNLAASLYFYLKTGVANGKITTRIFASDSPYDREKAEIGEVRTPMFEPDADHGHLERVKGLLDGWVSFVDEAPGTDHDFQAFEMSRGRE